MFAILLGMPCYLLSEITMNVCWCFAKKKKTGFFCTQPVISGIKHLIPSICEIVGA